MLLLYTLSWKIWCLHLRGYLRKPKIFREQQLNSSFPCPTYTIISWQAMICLVQIRSADLLRHGEIKSPLTSTNKYEISTTFRIKIICFVMISRQPVYTEDVTRNPSIHGLLYDYTLNGRCPCLLGCDKHNTVNITLICLINTKAKTKKKTTNIPTT